MLRFVWPSSTQSALVCATFNQSAQVCLTLYQSKHSSVLDIQPVKALQLVWPSANQSTTVSHSDKVLKLLLASTSNSLILSPAYADQLALQCQDFSCFFFFLLCFLSFLVHSLIVIILLSYYIPACPQRGIISTLGGPVMLLSSTVRTVNSQDRESTETWEHKHPHDTFDTIDHHTFGLCRNRT